MAGTDVVVICESGTVQTESANARLIAKGRTLSDHWGGELAALLIGYEIEAKAIELGRYVDEVYVADSPLHAQYSPEAYLEVAQNLVEKLDPRALLLGHTYLGMDLAPRLAARLGVGLASNCLDVRIEKGDVHFIRPMYRGRVHARTVIDGRPMIATLQPGGQEPVAGQRAGRLTRIACRPGDGERIRPLRTMEPARDGLDISKAEIVVAGGRGIGKKESFELVRELAGALGGVPACSRPLVDMGWLVTSHQVGLSGKMVKPKLYVACGISGAVEHVLGMKESQVIVAINKDPGAPIFRIAHYGIVGDLNEILPELIAEVRAAKAGMEAHDGGRSV